LVLHSLFYRQVLLYNLAWPGTQDISASASWELR
jgi:hypothetical protein